MIKRGQRVRSVTGYGYVTAGETGTVVYYRDGWTGVAWDEYDVHKHDCDGRCDDGHGYYVEERTLTEYCDSMDINEFI